MPLILATDAGAAADALAHLADEQRAARRNVLAYAPAVLLQEAGALDEELAETLREVLPELVMVELGSARFGRLNFDALALLALDLSPALLDAPAGRRLVDALGGLLREGKTLLLAGDAAGMAGALLAPDAAAEEDDETPLRAGLGLLPGALVLPSLQSADLRTLLQRLSEQGGRLLALEAPAAVLCEVTGAHAHFRMLGGGSAQLVAFAQPVGEGAPTARLHPLTHTQDAGWPA